MKIIIRNHMVSNYNFNIQNDSLEIILASGFKLLDNKEDQLSNCTNCYSRLDDSELVCSSKVFLLSFPLKYVLSSNHDTLIEHLVNLSLSEMKLGQSYSQNSIISRPNIYWKARDHFLMLQDRGHSTFLTDLNYAKSLYYLGMYSSSINFLTNKIAISENKNNTHLCNYYLGLNYLASADYKSARDVFLKIKRANCCDLKKVNMNLALCNFIQGEFYHGINSLTKTLELAKSEIYDDYFMHTLDHFVEKCFFILRNYKSSLHKLEYKSILTQLNYFYKSYNLYVSSNTKHTKFFKLNYEDFTPVDKIGNELLNQ